MSFSLSLQKHFRGPHLVTYAWERATGHQKSLCGNKALSPEDVSSTVQQTRPKHEYVPAPTLSGIETPAIDMASVYIPSCHFSLPFWWHWKEPNGNKIDMMMMVLISGQEKQRQ